MFHSTMSLRNKLFAIYSLVGMLVWVWQWPL